MRSEPRMIIVDTALEKRESDGKAIKVGIIGAGFMGSGIVRQILTSVKGMDVVAISNRTIEKAQQAYIQVGIDSLKFPETKSELEEAEQDCVDAEDWVRKFRDPLQPPESTPPPPPPP